MRKINYKSDFDCILTLIDCDGNAVSFPECDWDAVFWTSSKAKAYHASCIGGVCTNCRKEPDGISFIFDSHNMGLGTVHWEPHFRLPNGLYPDGYQDLFRKRALGIELVDGDGDEATETEIEYIIPYIKGDKGEPFTYADFTPDQIDELQKPATDAAAEVKATEESIQDAEALRVKAESHRMTAEESRATAEGGRATAEQSRVAAESSRAEAESVRATAEEARVSAERTRAEAETARAGAEAKRVTDFNAAQTQRANDYATFKTAVDSNESGRVNAEKARVTAEDARSEAETTRATAESNRVKNEQNRVTAESARVREESDRVTAEQNRASAESLRTTAEQGRVSAESSRVTAEQGRVTAEQSRVNAENARATEFAGFADTIAAKQDKITTSEDLSLSEQNELSLTDMAKKRLFIDLWNNACGKYGKYNATTGFFELNGLTDITYEQALGIYVNTHAAKNKIDFTAAFATITTGLRTNLPFATTQKSENGYVMDNAFRSAKIEVINLELPHYSGTQKSFRIKGLSGWVFKSKDTKRIMGPIEFINTSPNYNGWPVLLEEVEIYHLKTNLDMRECSKVSLASWQYMVTNAANTAAITVTVHPDVYAKLTDTENTEWNAVLTAAAAKNISFATI